MHRRKSLILMSLLILVSSPLLARDVVGWVEHATIFPNNVTLSVKVDTGAKTSSLHCECITPVEHDGSKWVSFSVKGKDGDISRIVKPIERMATVKRHFGEKQERYVVRLGLCMGSTYREEEVTLVDRSGFEYAMLVGRNFLKRDFLVDPEGTYLTPPNCKDAPFE